FFMGWLTAPSDLRYTTEQLEKTTKEDITQMLTERALKIHKDKEADFTSELMREIERMLLLRNVDSKWMDHIDSMEELKRGIGLRSIGQRDPIIEYRMEGFEMFEQMTESIKEDTVKQLLTVQLRRDEEVKREQVAKPTMAIGGDGSEAKRPVRAADKVGRNDLCPCGSGKKYKKCCGA
ncbi:MAG: SEC-C metal-binding domain-containing protein, partial [Angelakisella sp.]